MKNEEYVPPLDVAFDVARGLTAAIGFDRFEIVTLTASRITLQPARLADGAGIAADLGFNQPEDYRMLVPGYTLWGGIREGLVCQVRSSLRGTAVSNR